MITLKNTDTQTVTFYALPKFTTDFKAAIAKGKLAPHSETTLKAPATVNILFAFGETSFAALCSASDNSTVVFYNPGNGSWCLVS